MPAKNGLKPKLGMAINDRDIWIEPDGTIRYLEYSDFALTTLGEKRSKRLSRIEWNDSDQSWKVYEHDTGILMGSFESREKALEFEHEHFRRLLLMRHGGESGCL